MPALIASAASSSGTEARSSAYSSSGRMWVLAASLSDLALYYSDDGVTFTKSTATIPGSGFFGRTFSLYIDADDAAHVVAFDGSKIIYSRMAPVSPTGTWSAPLTLDTGDQRPDVVAHREGTGWVAHVVYSDNTFFYHRRVDISSAGAITLGTRDQIGSTTSPQPCHIDFRHTGDGKTVAGSPDLFIAWTTASGGVQSRRGVYSAGAWTFSTVRGIGSSSKSSGVFDGTRHLIAYENPSGVLVLAERDSADSTTTTRNPPALGDGPIIGLSVSYDSAGNAYIVAAGSTSSAPHLVKYDRAAGTFGSWSTLVDPGIVHNDELSLDRGYGFGGIGLVYTWHPDSGGTQAVSWMRAVVTNRAPNAPTLNTPPNGGNVDLASTNRLAWTFSDPDAGDSQSKFDLQWWDLDSSGARVGAAHTVTQSTPNAWWDAPAGTFSAGRKEWQARTYDSQGVVGPYSASSFFTAAVAPPTPTITSPVNGATVAASQPVTWSEPDQDSYQLRRVADNAGTIDTGTVYFDTGEVVDATTRTLSVAFPVNNRWEWLQVRVKDGGLWSPWASIRVQVSWTPPTTPTAVKTPVPADAAIDIVITNPAPGAGQPAVVYNNVYFAEPGEPEKRRATLIPPNSTWRHWGPTSDAVYLYRVEAVADNGTTSSSEATP